MEPHNSSEEETDVMVRDANGAVAVVGTERSATHPQSLEREQGVRVLGAEDGRMMCVLDWFDIEVEVAVVDRDGRSVSLAGFMGAALRVVSAVSCTLSPSVLACPPSSGIV